VTKTAIEPAAGSTGEPGQKTDSSTEPKGSDAPQGKTVPVAAVAEARAEKRAAKAEADELRQKLAELEKQNPQLDIATMVKTMTELTLAQAKAAVEAELRPVQDEVTKWRTAAQYGLNEQQADAVAAVRAKYPGMDDKAALAVVQSEKPDLFPRPAASSERRFNGVIPVGGDSMLREAPQSEDFMAKMRAAVANNDPAQATHWAEQEFFRRIGLARKKTL
jgi:hypothetical protein